ncbi:hypothetical protein BDV12DRAFT_30662 [Aspergillus spectabilis]
MSAFGGSKPFVGRKDDQIKVRGQRIEPGEIKCHLSRVPGVKKAVVMMPRREYWKDELVAIVQTTSHRASPTHSEPLRMLLADNLRCRLSKATLELLASIHGSCGFCCSFALLLTASMKSNRREVKAWLEMSENGLSYAVKEYVPPDNAVPLARNEQTELAISSIVEQYVHTLNPDWPIALSGYDFPFQEAGLNFIQTIPLSSSLRKQFGEAISLLVAMRIRLTARHLARLIDSPERASSYPAVSSLNIEVESRNISQQLLDSLHCQMIVPRLNRRAPIQNVFLKGATGYLGRQILRQLLGQQGAHLSVFDKQTNDSIKKAAALEGWWNESFHSRYTVWPGDLTKRRLGLSRAHLELLLRQGSAANVVLEVI